VWRAERATPAGCYIIFTVTKFSEQRMNTSEPHCKLVDMSKLKPKRTDWLWDKVIPRGVLTLFAGDGENAKSLTCMDIAARGSEGRAMPGETEGRAAFTTIVITSEDDAETDMVPRLQVAGWDSDKVKLLTEIAMPDGSVRGFHARDSIPFLSQTIDDIGDVGLVIVDPLAEFMGTINLWKDGDVRSALAPLRKLARDKKLGIVVVCHLNKGEGGARQRAIGSTAIVNTCRSAWLFAEDPDDPDRYLMLRMKNNPVKRRSITGRAFTLDDVKLWGEDVDGAPRINWSDAPVYLTADEALARQRANGKSDQPSTVNKFDHTVSWLRQMLATGAKSPRDVKVLAAEHLGVSAATLDRAKTHLGVLKNGLQLWELPPQEQAA
jgi:hypothetical protein